jgi:hypothetical protein
MSDFALDVLAADLLLSAPSRPSVAADRRAHAVATTPNTVSNLVKRVIISGDWAGWHTP